MTRPYVTEYAVRCRRDGAVRDIGTTDLATAEKWAVERDMGCGRCYVEHNPHVVVSRTVTAWEPVPSDHSDYDHARCGTSGGCAAPVADFDPVNCPAEASSPSRCGVPWSEHPSANGEPYCERSSCPAASVNGGSTPVVDSTVDGNDPQGTP